MLSVLQSKVRVLSEDTSESAGTRENGSIPFLQYKSRGNKSLPSSCWLPLELEENDPSARLAPPAILAELWEEGRFVPAQILGEQSCCELLLLLQLLLWI